MSAATLDRPVHRTDADLADAAIDLARHLLETSQGDESRAEARRRERLGALLADDQGRQLILAMTDEVLRIDEPRLAAERVADVVAATPPFTG